MAYIFLLGGITRLSFALYSVWPPSILSDYLNGEIFIGGLMLLTGAGLLKRVTVARTAAMGFLVVAVVGLPFLAIWATFNLQKLTFLLSIGAFLAHSLPKLPPELFSGLGMIMISLLIVWFITALFYWRLKSEGAIQEFGEDYWIFSDFIVAGFDLKVYFIATLLIGAQTSERWLPPSYFASRTNQEGKRGVEELKKLLGQTGDLSVMGGGAITITPENLKVQFGMFSTDEQKVAFFSNDARLFVFDIGKRQLNQFKVEYATQADRLMLSRDFKYIYRDREIFLLADMKIKYSLPREHLFWGFSAQSHQVLIYDKPNKKISLYDFLANKTLFEISDDLGDSGDLAADHVVWSRSRLHVLVPLRQGFRLIDVKIGQLIPLEYDNLSAVSAVFSLPEDALVYGGKTLSATAVKPFWLDLTSGNITPFSSDDIPLFIDTERKLIVLKASESLMARSLSEWNNKIWEIPLKGSWSTLVSPNGQWALLGKDGNHQLQALNLNTKQLNSFGLRFESLHVTKVKGVLFDSDRGNLAAFSDGRDIQVIWFSELAKPEPAVLTVNLPMTNTPEAAPPEIAPPQLAPPKADEPTATKTSGQ